MTLFRISTRFAAAAVRATGEEGAATTEHRASSIGDRVRQSFHELREPMYRYLQTSGASPADAEDIVQEALIRLYRQLHKGAEITEVRPWLYHVAHNLLIDQKRRSNRLGQITGGMQAGQRNQERSDPAPNPEESAVQRERYQQLSQNIDRLTEFQRECLSLRAEGLRYREIASVLDVSLSTVADAVRRAVVNLRRRLE